MSSITQVTQMTSQSQFRETFLYMDNFNISDIEF